MPVPPTAELSRPKVNQQPIAAEQQSTPNAAGRTNGPEPERAAAFTPFSLVRRGLDRLLGQSPQQQSASFFERYQHALLAPVAREIRYGFELLFRTWETAQPGPMASDRSVWEFYRLLDDPKIRHVIVIFHVSWCRVCKIMKPYDYQSKIEAINHSNLGVRIMTMDAEHPEDSFMKGFHEVVGWSPGFQGAQDYVFPSAIYVRSKDRTFYLGPFKPYDPSPEHILERIDNARFDSGRLLPALDEVR